MVVLKTQRSCGDVKGMKNKLSHSAKSITCPSVPGDRPSYYIFNPIFTCSLQAEKIKETGLLETGSQEMSRFPQET